eukprot:2059797-Pleurochrysis_carterae.AAC.1
MMSAPSWQDDAVADVMIRANGRSRLGHVRALEERACPGHPVEKLDDGGGRQGRRVDGEEELFLAVA